MRNILLGTTLLLAAAAMVPLRTTAAESTFQRDLTVNGTPELNVATGAGNIHITYNAGNRVYVFGRIHSGWGANDDMVRQIAANPPIEQTGNIIRIGTRHMSLHNISIDYEISAPTDAYLTVSTGSGGITDDGVGQNAKLSTGSGSIRATGMHGNFSAGTGSGSIYAEQVGDGEVKAETGSGSIELRNLHGSLHAQTGSGSIKAGGTPAGPWKLSTGSGGVELWVGAAGITLDASTGSGSIHTDHEITAQGTLSRHHVLGKINGGGPTVRVETGSGGIRVH